MKRYLFTLLAYILFIIGANASKAIPTPVTVGQPDGTQLTILLHGDEYFNWYSTTDGVLLCPVEGRFVVAEVQADGSLAPTTLLAHNSLQRQEAEWKAVLSQSRDRFFTHADRQLAKRREPLANADYFPHTGTPRAIVILAQYEDVKFTLPDPKKSFDLFFNSTEPLENLGNDEHRNHGSVKQYFTDMSNGAFVPEFDVFGPVTVPNEMKYYGGSSSTSASDERPRDLVMDALAQVEDQIDFDNPEYDTNGDGKIDLVYIVYAGYGQNSGGPAEAIWAKAGAISGTVQGKSLSRYCMTSELNLYQAYYDRLGTNPRINGVGVCCHEFSHTMGLPDLYPTTTSARVDNQEMEYWDLMDGGEYVMNGYVPTAYTAWERETMGWMEIETLGQVNQEMEVTAVEKGGTAYRFYNPADAREYMILENIQNYRWNASVPGHGLLVYHVKYPSTTVSVGDHPNNTAHRPGMAVVPADGILASSYLIGEETSWGTGTKTDADGNIVSDHIATRLDYQYSHFGDPFPGDSLTTQLTAEQQLPNYQWYTEDNTVRQALYRIAEDGETGVVSFLYSADGTGVASVSALPSDDRRIYSIDGRQLQTEGSALRKGLYIKGGKKYVVR